MSRYLEPSQPERFYYYPTTEVVTDPLKVTAASLGAYAVDKLVTGGSQVGDVASIAAFISGIASAYGGFAYFFVRALDRTAQNRADQRSQRMEGN